jgi:hypothetical protein
MISPVAVSQASLYSGATQQIAQSALTPEDKTKMQQRLDTLAGPDHGISKHDYKRIAAAVAKTVMRSPLGIASAATSPSKTTAASATSAPTIFGVPVLIGKPGGPSFISGGDRAELIVGNTAADQLRGGGGNDLIAGRDGNDRIAGGAGDDLLVGGRGNDVIKGNGGENRAKYHGDSSNYTIEKLAPGKYRVTDNRRGAKDFDGSDIVKDVQKLNFHDKTVHLDKPHGKAAG